MEVDFRLMDHLILNAGGYTEVAEKMGITRQTLYRIVKPLNHKKPIPPTIAHLNQLAEILDLEAMTFLKKSGRRRRKRSNNLASV